ncbi:MAG: site-specific DNA-methyltransferase [Alphaproteobacteria bacterium]|nr:site-specific DNA-methyltransferase [Alphaproteobacteria bacterium]
MMNLEKILKEDARIWDEEILDYPQLFELARTYDKDLLETLFSNKDSKKKFFIQVGDSHVFKYNEFRFYLEENQVNNSFTQYANKIGLSSQGEHLSDSTDYVLDWPYKDCVLEGGMSSEEDMDTFIEKKVETTPGKMDKSGNVISTEKTEVTFSQAKRKREEIFYNNIIADKEIDRLLDKKALKNFTRYTAKGEEKVKEIKRDEDGTIKENLLIKGNNLLALHSLKEEFAGKVKLIYIDPPYNTGNDGFAYNDKFNHSTWLTFMKNRLEIAKEFLREDGVIFVQIDNRMFPLLKLLMDIEPKLFGRKNHLSTITVKSKAGGGVGQESYLFDVCEYILVYAKDFNKVENYLKFVKTPLAENTTKVYNNIIENFGTEKEIKILSGGNAGDIKIFEHTNFTTKKLNKDERTVINYFENFENIFRTTNPQGGLMKRVMPEIPKSGLYSIEYIPTKGRNAGELYRYYFLNGGLLVWLKDTAVKDNNTKSVSKLVKNDNLWTENLHQGIANEGSVIFKEGKKPEKLIRKIIEMSTEEGDLVLDYHLGSGTTAAVAHKMGRQYLGIEQMDYKENSSNNRMHNVIKGDTSGISKEVNWKGGGDFIYFELAEYNEEAKNKIDTCKSYKELKKLFTELTDYYFLNYNVSVKQFNDQLLDDKDFQELPLEEQNTLFKALLDNNQLYIPYKEQQDGKYNLSKEDQELTNEFYGQSKAF